MAKVAVTGLVLVFVIFYVVTSPTEAANAVHNTWHFVVGIAHGFGTFIDRVTS